MTIGRHQLRLLILTASPTCVLVTPDRSSAGLVKRGLLIEDNAAGCTITPAGLRALADEMEAGRVATAIDKMKADAAWRRAPR